MSSITALKDQFSGTGRRRLSPWWILVAIGAFGLLLSLLQVVTGADDMASSGTLRAIASNVRALGIR